VDSQAILFNMLDRFTGSHLLLLTMLDDLQAGLMTASLSGTVSPAALMNRRTGRLGRQVVRLISRGETTVTNRHGAEQARAESSGLRTCRGGAAGRRVDPGARNRACRSASFADGKVA
jgi:hypothetical protein